MKRLFAREKPPKERRNICIDKETTIRITRESWHTVTHLEQEVGKIQRSPGVAPRYWFCQLPKGRRLEYHQESTREEAALWLVAQSKGDT